MKNTFTFLYILILFITITLYGHPICKFHQNKCDNEVVKNATSLRITDNVNFSSRGYENLDSLYSDFVDKLKLGGQELKDFCSKICADIETIRYLEKKKILNNDIVIDEMKINTFRENYIIYVNGFREKLIRRKRLNDIVYIGREHKKEDLLSKELGIYFTETFILMKSGSDTIKYNLGEMMKIKGVWKTFTEPKK